MDTDTTTRRPRIFTDGEKIGAFDEFDTVMVPVSSLRAGMVLVDPDLRTAVYSLDHRLRAPRNSGSVVWFVEDLEEGGYTKASFGARVSVPVAAA